MSQSSDQYRPAYGAVAVDRPRTCIFIASTNANAYLPDASGNRRFLPIPCGKIDIGAFLRDRDQLFAEAVRIVKKVTTGHTGSSERLGQPLRHALAARFGLDPQHWAAAASLSDDRRITDPVEDVLPGVVGSRAQGQRLPNGRKFIASSVLLEGLRIKLNSPVRQNGIRQLDEGAWLVLDQEGNRRAAGQRLRKVTTWVLGFSKATSTRRPRPPVV